MWTNLALGDETAVHLDLVDLRDERVGRMRHGAADHTGGITRREDDAEVLNVRHFSYPISFERKNERARNFSKLAQF
jgi:hypothetical protein